MPISWNEIRTRTIQFMKEWEDESRERAEKDTFWNEFFEIFGLTRRHVATFEHYVKRLDRKHGFIDLFWPGHLLAEHKSRGVNLDLALDQAHSYLYGLKQEELPKMIIVSDFERFAIYDFDDKKEYHFGLNELLKNIEIFGFIAGYRKKSYQDEHPVNAEAAARMGVLHDKLDQIGYTGHALEVYLVRLLFCLFADDTGIFERGIFHEYIDLHTKEDGSDLAAHLAQIFQTLNTPREKRLKNLDENLNRFPYVNGAVFAEPLPFAAFDSGMRHKLLNACALDWGNISPAIFGSMFQAAMNPQERRDLGAHYTSEQNIMKVIEPLFLDQLKDEMQQATGNSRKLKDLHNKIAGLKFLDPACGSGNFLIIAYRELRRLELDILTQLHSSGQGFLDIGDIIRINVNQFYGIEYDEFPARIAEVAMWLMDHQMNNEASKILGQSFVRLPLTEAAHIRHANALRVDWQEVVPKEDLDYILGNPPFLGSRTMNREQKQEMVDVFDGFNKAKSLDYVSAWYYLAAKYIKGTKIKAAFVSTNSITQGLQVGLLWEQLINKGLHIHFAHKTFKWNNEAKGNASVYCVIIGFANTKPKEIILFEYPTVDSEPIRKQVSQINPYLVEADNIFIESKSSPICDVPEMAFGNMPADGGQLLLTDEEKTEFLLKEPQAQEFIKPLISAREFLNNEKRWCIWLNGVSPTRYRHLPLIMERIKNLKEIRLNSSRPHLADIPMLFAQITQPEGKDFLLVPAHSSERRNYIPMGFFSAEHISHNSCLIVPEATLYHFGVMMSKMHMEWTKYTCGRLESRYRYSKEVVYNNFPWPQDITEAQKERVETAAQAVLDARVNYPESSLADLYDPLTMPPDLVRAHKSLDKAVDLCYRPQPFENEMERMGFLFNLYEEIT